MPAAPAPGEFPPRGAVIEDVRQHEPAGLAAVTVVVVPPLPERAVAGLSEQEPAEPLTWDRVYTLALVRARSGGDARLAGSLDPTALAEQARRLEVGDFARFRKELFAGQTEKGPAFHDPGEAYLTVLRRLQIVANARQQDARLESLLRLVQELVQGQSSGLSQLDVDLVMNTLLEARLRRSREIAAYRNALDELKPALGLSPRAAVLPDRSSIAAFDRVFDQVDAWKRLPDRQLAALPRIVEGLPELGILIIAGRPVPRYVDPAIIWPMVAEGADHVGLDDLLKQAAGQALRNHAAAGRPDADGGAALELRVRRRVRRLLAIRNEYEGARRMYVLAVRLQDQAFERMIAPSSAAVGPVRGSSIQGLVDALERGPVAQDRLVTLWTEFRAERLGLYRDLGALPYGNWDAFHASLRATAAAQPARAADPVRDPAVPPPVPPAPSAPQAVGPPFLGTLREIGAAEPARAPDAARDPAVPPSAPSAPRAGGP